MSRTAFVYVPTTCWNSIASCEKHVKYHGCGGGGKHTPADAQDMFYEETPYIAEANNIVILYPQAVGADQWRDKNPEGCWDWKGYYGRSNFDTHAGAHMNTVLAMLKDLANAVG